MMFALLMRNYINITAMFTFILCTCVSGRFVWWERCYENPPIGCFSIRKPYNNAPLIPFPMERFDMHYIHHFGSDTVRYKWDENVETMRPRFRSDLNTCVIVPGWNEPLVKVWIPRVISELKKKEQMNIILVDWTGASVIFRYKQAISNGRVAGAMIAYMIQELVDNLGGDLEKFHLIGNSLGCHVCGHAGERLPGLKRITGMDPSGRLYDGTPPEVRLDPTDAQIVDVIHTDGSSVIGFGSKRKMGTIDFFPNGGHNQPGCTVTPWGIISDMIFGGIGFNKCSHTRATILFIDSINKCKLISNQCCSPEEAWNEDCEKCSHFRNTAVFGYDVGSTSKGEYWFSTHGKESC